MSAEPDLRFGRILDEYGPPLWRLTAAYARTAADREDLYPFWPLPCLSRGPSAMETGILGLLWVVAGGASVFSHLNRRGVWRATGETTMAYLELTERRALRKVRVAAVVGALSLVEAALVAWLVLAGGAGFWSTVTLAGLLASGYLGWAAWYGRRAAAEMRDLTELRERMGARNGHDVVPRVEDEG